MFDVTHDDQRLVNHTKTHQSKSTEAVKEEEMIKDSEYLEETSPRISSKVWDLNVSGHFHVQFSNKSLEMSPS